MGITIKQIAEIAGVSRAAVDKVLHDRPGISNEVRIRVKNIAREYNYVPNQFARALSNTEKHITFAVIIPSPKRALFFQMLRNGMNDAAKALAMYGVRLEFYYTDGFNLEAMNPILEYLEKQNIQGLAIRFQDDEHIKAAIDLFTEKGVTVVTFDSDIPDSKRICFIGEDNIKSGRIAASLLSKCSAGRGKVALITGSNFISAHNLRVKGFYEIIKESYPNIEVIPPIETHEQGIIEYKETKKLLAEHPDIAGIFIAAGRIKRIAQALEEADLEHHVNVVVCDYVQESSSYVKKGMVDFAIGLAPFNEGQIVIETLFDVVYHNKQIEDTFIRTPTFIYTDENIEEFN